MSEALIIQLVRETLWLSLMLCAPILLVTLVVGLIISIFQAATQISEMTLTFIPKLLVAGIVMIFTFPWMLHQFSDFFVHLVSLFRQVHA